MKMFQILISILLDLRITKFW